MEQHPTATLCTIGLYGMSVEAFHAALEEARITDFVDVRSRRGVRGPSYAFANARRLVASIEGRGIRYHHWRSLAPSAELRAMQRSADAASGHTQRTRTTLSPAFVHGYLTQLGPEVVLDDERARVVRAGRACLFCVERAPAACHRGPLAARIATELGVAVRHL